MYKRIPKPKRTFLVSGGGLANSNRGGHIFFTGNDAKTSFKATATTMTITLNNSGWTQNV